MASGLLSNAPRVSVVIPNYNHAAFLSQRIDSVLSQTFKDIEIILLDDASSDESPAMLRRFADHPLVAYTLFSKLNSSSPLFQWQKGIEKARGEWIWIAESDDFADEDFLNCLLEAARANPEAGLIYCDSQPVIGNEIIAKPFSERKNKSHRTNRWSTAHSNRGLDELEDYLLPHGTINNTSAVIFRASLLKQFIPFELPLRYIGDKFVFTRMLANSNIVYVPRVLNYYRDPFTKAEGKLLFYVYEQFLLFDWVIRNVPSLRREKVIKAFYRNSGLSLIKGWDREKVSIFVRMFRCSPSLFFRWIAWNVRRPLTISA